MASNISTGQVILEGNVGGWSRYKIAIPAPPTGTDQAIYLIRAWLDEIPSNTDLASNSLAWRSGQHLGFSFSATHPTKPSTLGSTGLANAKTAYTNLFGLGTWGQTSSSNTSAGWSSQNSSDAAKRDYCVPAKDDASGELNYLIGRGNGDTLTHATGTTTDQPSAQMPFTVPRNPAFGATATTCLRVYSDSTNEAVYMDSWKNLDSINLDTLDLQNDIDGSNPKTKFPVSNSWAASTQTLNANPTTGTNWRPSSRVMGFPTYFMVQHPMVEQKLVIDYVGVRYDKQAT